jgi:acyl-CoA synthetase (AMP-forming)/AMP-acid ligase II
LPRGIREKCAELLGCVVKQGYGLTETSSTTNVDYDDPVRVRPDSVGPLVRSTECQIIDLSRGGALGAGQMGEVLVRGPQVMRGYLNNPQATQRAIGADGWLHTGDVGYMDEDGYLYIVDRLKEMIKYKGYQVAPAELEEVLMTHPQVRDAAVIPVPDEVAGEIPKAFIVREGPIESEALLRYVAERVAPFKRIHEVVFVEQIPKSGTGKPLRRLLAERERAGPGRGK